MTDAEFLRECAALFRNGDPNRAKRLDSIASASGGASAGGLPHVDESGLHVWTAEPSNTNGINGEPIPVSVEKVIPIADLDGASVSRITVLATSKTLLCLSHGRGEVVEALRSAGLEVFA